jgi:hypothetical protein
MASVVTVVVAGMAPWAPVAVADTAEAEAELASTTQDTWLAVVAVVVVPFQQIPQQHGRAAPHPLCPLFGIHSQTLKHPNPTKVNASA